MPPPSRWEVEEQLLSSPGPVAPPAAALHHPFPPGRLDERLEEGANPDLNMDASVCLKQTMGIDAKLHER